MEFPLSEDDSEMEELLHQLEDESLLETQLASFSRGSGSFVPQGHGDGTNVLSADLENRYENLKARSCSSGSMVAEVAGKKETKAVQAGEEEPKGMTHDLVSEPQAVGSFKRNTGRNSVEAEPGALSKSTTEPLSKPQNPLTAAAKKSSREISPSPSPPDRCSCFCISPREPKGKQRSRKRRAGSRARGSSGGSGHRKAWISDRVKEEDEGWEEVVRELEGIGVGTIEEKEEGIDVSLVDVKKNEEALKRVSENERKLTYESEKLVDSVIRLSARFCLSPDSLNKHLSSKHS